MSEPTTQQIGDAGRQLCSSALLGDFGNKCLDDLLQGEWEPDWEWRDNMLERAEKMGLIRRRPVTPEDDITDEFDFIWERVKSPNGEFRRGGPDVATQPQRDPPSPATNG